MPPNRPEGEIQPLDGEGERLPPEPARWSGYLPAAAAVLVVAAVIGLQGGLGAGDQPPPPATSLPSSASLARSPAHAASTSPRPLGVGRQLVRAVPTVQLTIGLPRGWSRVDSSESVWLAESRFGRLAITAGATVGSRGCLAGLRPAGGPGPRPTPTAEGSSVPGLGASRLGTTEPVDFVLGPYPGQYVEFTQATTCDSNRVWDEVLPDGGRLLPYSRVQLWVLDVEGTALVVGAYTGPLTAPQAYLEEVRLAVESLEIIAVAPPEP